jgi:hypothetical protein
VGAAVAASVRAGAGAAAGVGCESRACVAGAGAVYTAPLIDSRDLCVMHPNLARARTRVDY